MQPATVRRDRLVLVVCAAAAAFIGLYRYAAPRLSPDAREPAPAGEKAYKRRMAVDTSGFLVLYDPRQPPWDQLTSLEEVAAAHRKHLAQYAAGLDEALAERALPAEQLLLKKAALLHSQGKPTEAYQVLKQLEAEVRGSPQEEDLLYTVVYYLGVTGLRIGENDNCLMCRGESSCIFPIAPAAVHTNPAGSRRAVEHFTEYLRVFPDDFEVRWLLNVAHMTLGEHPAGVDPRHRLELGPFLSPEHAIGAFRDVGHRVGVQRFNQSGGAIMDDFDADGLLDLVVTDWAPGGPMAFYRNKGDGTFEDRTAAAGLGKQAGGLYCVQTDYNNDGYLDVFVPRGAWMPGTMPVRPSLLRNKGDGTFADVTREAGLAAPHNSNSAAWADYDNDGLLDLFVCTQHRPVTLYRNKGDGTFEEVAARAGLPADLRDVLGAAWFDYDNDGYPDLFANIGVPPVAGGGIPRGKARLYHNNRDGTFTDVTAAMGIDGPPSGFSCWAFDYDNDGWIDIFATSTIHSLEDIVKGIVGQPHELPTPVLYRNLGGKGFQDVTREVGLDKLCAPMGTNFGDLDNDGYLDIYLATGNPDLATLIPNRLFRNLRGKRFADITASSRTGHLQKGHGVAIGDWNRDGSPDLFVQLGGAVPGDRYHNVLFHNPGQTNHWLNVKLVGRKSNRPGVGARLTVVTAGPEPRTVHRHVTSGSSFGANPLEQHVGLGTADRVARLEVYWPTSGTTQVFHDLTADQGVVITEFAAVYQTRAWKPIAVPPE